MLRSWIEGGLCRFGRHGGLGDSGRVGGGCLGNSLCGYFHIRKGSTIGLFIGFG